MRRDHSPRRPAAQGRARCDGARKAGAGASASTCMNEHAARAERFLALHYAEAPLLLANPWDSGSAKLLERRPRGPRSGDQAALSFLLIASTVVVNWLSIFWMSATSLRNVAVSWAAVSVATWVPALWTAAA